MKEKHIEKTRMDTKEWTAEQEGNEKKGKEKERKERRKE